MKKEKYLPHEDALKTVMLYQKKKKKMHLFFFQSKPASAIVRPFSLKKSILGNIMRVF